MEDQYIDLRPMMSDNPGGRLQPVALFSFECRLVFKQKVLSKAFHLIQEIKYPL